MKILHLSHHNGCFNEIRQIFSRLGFDVEEFRKVSEYNITRELANHYWGIYKDYFEKFDLIITSDTAALSRIFLQNNFKGNLLIWICNRFDSFFGDEIKNRGLYFPDDEFYELFKFHFENQIDKVRLIPFCEYEFYYVRNKGITPISNLYIEPSGLVDRSVEVNRLYDSHIFLQNRHNEKLFNLEEVLDNMGISFYSGRYFSPVDLKQFHCMIQIPYCVQLISPFELWNMEIPVLIPSSNFLLKMSESSGFWFHGSVHGDGYFSLTKILKYTNHYKVEHRDLYIQYDDFEDIKYLVLDDKILNINRELLRNRYREDHLPTIISKWKRVLGELNCI